MGKYNFDGMPLGEVTDPVIAKMVGCSVSAVMSERRRRDIPACKKNINQKKASISKVGKCQLCGKKGLLTEYLKKKLCPLCLNPPYETTIEDVAVMQSAANNGNRGWY